jgi:myosin heavy subunit
MPIKRTLKDLKIRELEAENEYLFRVSTMRKEKIEQLKASLEDRIAIGDSNRRMAEELTSQLITTATEVSKLKTERDSLLKSQVEKANLIEGLKKDFSQSRLEYSEMVSRHHADLKQRNKIAESRQEDIFTLKKAVTEMDASLKKAKIKLKEMSEARSMAESAMEKQNQEVTKLQNENHELKHEVTQLKHRLSIGNGIIDKLHYEVEHKGQSQPWTQTTNPINDTTPPKPKRWRCVKCDIEAMPTYVQGVTETLQGHFRTCPKHESNPPPKRVKVPGVFYPGDRVICINNEKSDGSLNKGSCYIVESLNEYDHEMRLVGVNSSWFNARFEHVE